MFETLLNPLEQLYGLRMFVSCNLKGFIRIFTSKDTTEVARTCAEISKVLSEHKNSVVLVTLLTLLDYTLESIKVGIDVEVPPGNPNLN